MLDFEKWKEKAENPAATFYTHTSQTEGLTTIKQQAFQTDFCSLLGKTVTSMPEELEQLGGIATKL